MSSGTPSEASIGARLRQIRHGHGWTLKDVEERSGGRFTIGSVGAYERGTRMISAERLVALCAVYDVHPTVLFDEPELEAGHDLTVVIDLTRVEESDETELAQLCDRVRRMRHGQEGRYLPLRDSDLERLATVRGVEFDDFAGQLRAAGLAVDPRSGAS